MLPELFLERMKGMLGSEYEDFLASFEQEKYQALRLNALKKNMDGRFATEILTPTAKVKQASEPLTDGEHDQSDVKNAFLHLEEVLWAQNGYYYDKEDQPGKHPYHEAGVYYIQEPSAMAPVGLLEVRPGERVLDLCAAPGGKSTQIAAALQGEGLLLCNEIHPARAKILSENVERMGIRNACVTNESPARLAEVFVEYFDKILVDAPCSGEGMFRKNEAACEEWSPENVELCAARQDEILDCAARMLRPGGRLVYSTCTFATLENEGSISRFAERHPEFEVQNSTRLWPHKVKGEGHFMAVLHKAGEESPAYRVSAAGGTEKGIPEKNLMKEWAEYFTFAKETLRTSFSGGYLKFGDNLYLMPEEMPAIKGLKVLRPGLHIGTLKKNRFEPSHALALALAPEDAVHVWNLSSAEGTVNAYLNGQTFSAEGEKGWYLICVDGFSIGWGKLAGGIMKNHYPKGLRKNF